MSNGIQGNDADIHSLRSPLASIGIPCAAAGVSILGSIRGRVLDWRRSGAGNGTFQPSMESATLSIPSAGLADGHYRVGMRPETMMALGAALLRASEVQDEEALAALGGEYFGTKILGLVRGEAINKRVEFRRAELSTDGLGLGDHPGPENPEHVRLGHHILGHVDHLHQLQHPG